jgi:lipopolysaccharide transport system permease protein/teichoic acid transport system permease protein
MTPSGNVPYVAYLFTGMIAYWFFESAVGSSPGVIKSYSYLVQKVQFRVSILPIVKINSALILHLIFVLIVMGIIVACGIFPSLYWFQALYYMIALLFLMLGSSWLLSALGVFIQDTSQILGICLRFGFWLTPIFWQIDMIPDKYHMLLKLNPLFYIVQGYRDSFIYKIPLWHRPAYALYYWGVSTAIFVIGVVAFKRLRPHFADVL